MVMRKKIKDCKILRRCSCGCGRLCNGHDILRVVCAVDYVKKLGYEVICPIWKRPLRHWEFKRELEIE